MPPASAAGIEVPPGKDSAAIAAMQSTEGFTPRAPRSLCHVELRVKWMIELMKIEGKWDAKKA